MIDQSLHRLEKAIEEITKVAKSFGLDFFDMRYEICPADIIYTFGAYGMPTRFSHWSFGKNFHKMKMQYDLGLSKIYELVINSDPCYAFLLEGNTLVQNKLIVAHVLAHSDFFKNNARFSRTNRNMIETMSASASRIREYEIRYGTSEVEQFVDAVLAVQEHISPSITQFSHERQWKQSYRSLKQTQKKEKNRVPSYNSYEDLWDDFPADDDELTREPAAFPEQPEKDLLWFIEQHATHLHAWQRDILSMLRDEMLYFWPQIETKIMNEGWASYWHTRIMRELPLTSEETIEYSKLNSSVVAPSTGQLNPYYLGYKIFESIEEKWGQERMFEIREYDADISFLRNYLTKELVEELDLYVFEKKGIEWKVTDKAWENVRDQLVQSRVNGGFPYITVTNGDHNHLGELYLVHQFESIELDIKYIEKTLPFVYRLWGKPVHLQTVIEQKNVLFSYDGNKQQRKFL